MVVTTNDWTNIPYYPTNREKKDDEVFTEDGILFDSAEFSDLESDVAREKITEKLISLNKGEKQINFKFRDWVFSRQRYWGEPFPFKYKEQVDQKIIAGN